MRFAHQVLLLQIGVLALVVGVGFALVAVLLDRELTDQYKARALAVANAVSSDPEIAAAAARDDPDGLVARRAEQIRSASDALFVVVTNRDGIRLSHPTPSEIGRRVSTDPSAALSGQTVTTVERGTLGLSARAKVPLKVGDTIIGEVSVGFAVREIQAQRRGLLRVAAPFAVGALLLGVAGSVLLTRRLRRSPSGWNRMSWQSWSRSGKRSCTASARECSPSTTTAGSPSATTKPHGCSPSRPNPACRSPTWSCRPGYAGRSTASARPTTSSPSPEIGYWWSGAGRYTGTGAVSVSC
jgi:hypothetical protein